tara:strand:- start:787 stop:1098 length:312 start_codon:yes stop_codon:yes gene_type:complete
MSVTNAATIDLDNASPLQRGLILLFVLGVFLSPLIFKAVRKDSYNSLKETGKSIKSIIGAAIGLIFFIGLGIAFSLFQIVVYPLIILLFIVVLIFALINYFKQ